MANYIGTTRTNYFRVIDEEKYAEIFGKLWGDDAVNDFTYTDNDGVIWHGFGCYGEIFYGEEDFSLDGFYDAIQSILPNDEALMVFEVGHDKLRYLTGVVQVVTKNTFDVFDLDTMAINHARKIIGENFVTKTCY